MLPPGDAVCSGEGDDKPAALNGWEGVDDLFLLGVEDKQYIAVAGHSLVAGGWRAEEIEQAAILAEAQPGEVHTLIPLPDHLAGLSIDFQQAKVGFLLSRPGTTRIELCSGDSATQIYPAAIWRDSARFTPPIEWALFIRLQAHLWQQRS